MQESISRTSDIAEDPAQPLEGRGPVQHEPADGDDVPVLQHLAEPLRVRRSDQTIPPCAAAAEVEAADLRAEVRVSVGRGRQRLPGRHRLGVAPSEQMPVPLTVSERGRASTRSTNIHCPQAVFHQP
jgi:hypothetical protein